MMQHRIVPSNIISIDPKHKIMHKSELSSPDRKTMQERMKNFVIRSRDVVPQVEEEY